MKQYLKRLQFHVMCMVGYFVWWLVIKPILWLSSKFSDAVYWLDDHTEVQIDLWLEEHAEEGDLYPIGGIMVDKDVYPPLKKCTCPGCTGTQPGLEAQE